MFHFGETARRQRRWLTGALFGALGLLAVAVSLLAVIDRTASRYDAASQSRASENVPRDQAQKALAREEKALEKAEADASAECRSGDGLKCKSLKQRATEARERLAKARSELTKLGARTAEDPAARRIADVLGVSEAQIGTVQPLLLPVWLELSGLVPLTYGLSSPTRLPEAPAEKPKRKARKEKQAPRRPAAQDGVTDWVAAYANATVAHPRSRMFARHSASPRPQPGVASGTPAETNNPREPRGSRGFLFVRSRTFQKFQVPWNFLAKSIVYGSTLRLRIQPKV